MITIEFTEKNWFSFTNKLSVQVYLYTDGPFFRAESTQIMEIKFKSKNDIDVFIENLELTKKNSQ